MKTSQKFVFGLASIALIIVGFLISKISLPGSEKNPHRMVTIVSADTSNGDKAGTCQVDYPVLVVRQNKKHTVEWQAENNNGPFWLQFVTVDSHGVGTPSSVPVSSGGTTVTQPIKIDKSGSTGRLDIDKSSQAYYTYEIWATQPVTYATACKAHQGEHGYPCKCGDDEQDTGLNVKR